MTTVCTWVVSCVLMQGEACVRAGSSELGQGRLRSSLGFSIVPGPPNVISIVHGQHEQTTTAAFTVLLAHRNSNAMELADHAQNDEII